MYFQHKQGRFALGAKLLLGGKSLVLWIVKFNSFET